MFCLIQVSQKQTTSTSQPTKFEFQFQKFGEFSSFELFDVTLRSATTMGAYLTTKLLLSGIVCFVVLGMSEAYTKKAQKAGGMNVTLHTTSRMGISHKEIKVFYE